MAVMPETPKVPITKLAELPPRVKDRTGDRIGRLTVVGLAGIYEKRRIYYWDCECECGNKTCASSNDLGAGKVKSCGCQITIHNKARAKHGLSKTKTYTSWKAMMARCYNESNPSYKYYAPKGIVVCERWKDYINFLEDMGERPPGMSIERIDNDGNYEPSNCRWATPQDQSENKRNNRNIEAFGRTQCLTKWANEYGISPSTLHTRIFRFGWMPEKALTGKTYSRRKDNVTT